MNTDKRGGKGKHWVCVYFDARPNGTKSIEYYDSFGDGPTPLTMKGLKQLSDKISPDTYLKMKINRVKRQSVSTSNCGYFCMEFLINRYRDKSFAEATGFDPDKKIDMSAKGEKSVERFKQQIGGSSFSFI
jgi:hypothetical protein